MAIVLENGRLFSKIEGQPTVSLRPIGAHNFYVPMNGIDIYFKMDADGSAVSLQILNGKNSMEFNRKK